MQDITTSWFVQGMIKATSDAWLTGWDERHGGKPSQSLVVAGSTPLCVGLAGNAPDM